MAERTTTTVELERVERQLSSWRGRHGGPGRPIPQELWAAAAEVAAVAGVKETARVLGVDRTRLARRVGERSSGALSAVAQPTRLARSTPASAAFVEVDARRVFARGKTVIRLTSHDGEQLEIEVEGEPVDMAAVVRAFQERAR